MAEKKIISRQLSGIVVVYPQPSAKPHTATYSLPTSRIRERIGREKAENSWLETKAA